MAKKNSSKTATEKAIQSSEPRVINYRGWKGVNFVDAPLTWDPLETGVDKFRQTDLPANFLMVQNNLNTTDTLGLETRQDSVDIGDVPSGCKFTGVSCVYKHWLFCVVRQNTEGTDPIEWREKIIYRSLKDESTTQWTTIDTIINGSRNRPFYAIEEIGFFESNLVATLRFFENGTTPKNGLLLLAKVETRDDDADIDILGMDWSTADREETIRDTIVDTPEIANPAGSVPITLTAKGMKSAPVSSTPPDNAPVRVSFCFCYTNRLGSTLVNTNIAEIYVELSPQLWTTKKYVQISSTNKDTHIVPGSSIAGIDIYWRELENIDWAFAGHLDVKPAAGGVKWSFNWYGAMTDIAQWTTSQLMIPTENTTHGPDATHFNCHDSRIYYWGMPSKPYRLWIGGNPGSEFSIARGLGGAWVDIEPGSGYDIMGTAKWKTTSGANIVTIMCGNRNTTKIKRFNLVETNLTLTNEVTYKSYMYEEVSNVVGCNSRWGYGVFTDGLYSLNRYGLMLTTMAMEYNSQMKNQKMSDVIDPIFTDRLGKRLRDGRMVCINEIIYIALSEDEEHGDEPMSLDNVILCYDMNQQAWYTWTHDQTYGASGSDPDKILHILAIDSDEFEEACKRLGIKAGSFISDDIADLNHDVAEFVARFYRVCLNRRFDKEGLDSWIRALVNGEATGALVAWGFLDSEEYKAFKRSDEKYIEDLYNTFLGRSSDAEGKENWLRVAGMNFTRKYLFGIKSPLDKTNIQPVILELQALYYIVRIKELNDLIYHHTSLLASYDSKVLLSALTDHSMAVLKNALNNRYSKEQRRMFNDVKELRLYAEELVNQYPVVLSTTFSARTAVPDMVYDYLIMDEASQVSIETGALALTCAKNAVIVGDTLQLPNVVTDEDKLKLDTIFKEYKVLEGYNCAEYSFLQSVCAVMPNIKQTLLREHYRCHPKIINFCNQRDYDRR